MKNFQPSQIRLNKRKSQLRENLQKLAYFGQIDYDQAVGFNVTSSTTYDLCHVWSFLGICLQTSTHKFPQAIVSHHIYLLALGASVGL